MILRAIVLFYCVIGAALNINPAIRGDRISMFFVIGNSFTVGWFAAMLLYPFMEG